jgi:protein-tyrosine phosphatase
LRHGDRTFFVLLNKAMNLPCSNRTLSGFLALGFFVACGGVPVVSGSNAAAGAGGEETASGGVSGASYGGDTGGADASSVGGTATVSGIVPVGGMSSGTTSNGGNASTVCGSSPWVLVGKVPNARQLGGVPLAGGATVTCDKLYRGAYLSSLTTTACEAFSALGIRSVLDLRSLGEQAVLPSACVTEQALVVSAPMPVPYNVSPSDYVAILYTAESMKTVFRILADETAYPVYFHCLYGKDRTGVVTAVILSALGASRETILSEYELTAVAGYSCYPDSLIAVLDEIERIGGIDAYFEKVGVPQEEVATLRRLLITKSDTSS